MRKRRGKERRRDGKEENGRIREKWNEVCVYRMAGGVGEKWEEDNNRGREEWRNMEDWEGGQGR